MLKLEEISKQSVWRL